MHRTLLESVRSDDKHRTAKHVVAGATLAGLAGLGIKHLRRKPHNTFKYTKGLGKAGAILGAGVGGVQGAALAHHVGQSRLAGALGGAAGGAVGGGIHFGSIGALGDTIRYIRRKH